MARFEEKPYFLRAKLLRNWLAIEAIYKHSRVRAAGDREQDNGQQLAGRLDKRAVASSSSRRLASRVLICLHRLIRLSVAIAEESTTRESQKELRQG
jgi:hypothetical protein